MPKPFDPTLHERRTEVDKRDGAAALLALIVASTFLCSIFLLLIRLFR